MKLNDLNTPVFKSWKNGSDNTDANDDIPLEESFDTSNPTPTMKSILETKEDSFSEPMSYEEFLAWHKTL